MAVNKVVFGNTTIMDISDSTLESNDQLGLGVTAYDRSGTLRTGTMTGYPTFSSTGTITPSVSGGSIVSSNLKYALTTDKKFGMIWGYIMMRGTGTSNQLTLDFGVQVNAPTNAIQIFGDFSTSQNINTQAIADYHYLNIDTSGNITFKYACTTNATYYNFPPVILRFSDFE